MANWHIQELTVLEKKLNTDLSDGLSAREARLRLDKEYKRNKKGRKKILEMMEDYVQLEKYRE